MFQRLQSAPQNGALCLLLREFAPDVAQERRCRVALASVLIVFGIPVLLVLPAIALLFTLAQRNLIEETAQPEREATGSPS